MDTVLITGAAGYIGSVLVPILLHAKYKVIALDTFSRNDASLLSSAQHPYFYPVRGDARDESLIRRHLKSADIIIPLAGIVGAPMCEKDPIAAQSTNLDAIKMICQLSHSHQKIIYPTTNSGYGIGKPGILCTENTPLNPISLYGKTKVEAEKYVLETENGVTLRLATVFGIAPRMRIDLLVNDFTYRALNDRFIVLFEGNAKRNYIHVQDVAQTFLYVIKNFDHMKQNAYNVGLSSANLSKIELCEKIRQQVEGFVYFMAPIGKDPDQRNYIVSNEKIEKTGWKANYTLDMGIIELIRGYQMIRNTRFGNI